MEQPTVAEAVYLQAGSATAFAMVHKPTGVDPSGIGIVMCPASSWNELCIHRDKWRWAQALSGAGHTVIRFDLPGNGDSAGTPTADDASVDTWIDVVGAAAKYLRTNLGARRVVALGVELGGMLAWAATAAGAAIDDLILWSVPSTGSRLVRELRAGARIDFIGDLDAEAVRQFDPAQTGEPDPLDGGFIDEAGQIVSRSVIDRLGQIKLARLPLATTTDPNTAKRGALIFQRTGSAADEKLIAAARDTGLDVTVAGGDEYTAMMQYVQLSKAPSAAIASSLRWLDRPGGRTASTLYPSASVAGVSSTLNIVQDGRSIRERPITITVDGKQLRGIITEPIDRPAIDDFCSVLVSGSSDRRIGPNRLWVDCARSWAARGVLSVRLDVEGVGDSDGDERRWDNPWFHHEPGRSRELRAVLDALQSNGLPGRFLLTGFCSGAVKSYRLAAMDRRIVGLFGINMPFLLPRLWNRYVRDWWVVDWEPKPHTPGYRIALMHGVQRTLASCRSGLQTAMHRGPRLLDPDKQTLTKLSDRGAEILFMIRPERRQLDDLIGDERPDRIADLPNVKIAAMPSNDVRFRPLPAQRWVSAELDGALTRLLSRESAD